MSARLQSIAGGTSIAFDVGGVVWHEAMSVQLSERQADMFAVLFQFRYDDRFLKADEINARAGRSIRPGSVAIYLGAKLRRVRLALEGRGGPGGGYRLREVAP